MSTEYTKWTVNKILNTTPIETDKLHVLDVEDFMHPELYERVQQSIPGQWQNEDLPGRHGYHVGPDDPNEALRIATEYVYRHQEVLDAIGNVMNMSNQVNVNQPFMWMDTNKNSVHDVHVDHPSYYYTIQHSLAFDDEFAHTGTMFWEVDCAYDQAIDEGLDPTFGEDSTLVKMGHQMPFVPNRTYILPRSSKGWHSCPDLTKEPDHMQRVMVYMIATLKKS